MRKPRSAKPPVWFQGRLLPAPQRREQRQPKHVVSAQLRDATHFLPDELCADFAVALSLAEIGDRFGDRFDRLFGRGAADRDGFRGAMEIEPADMADARSDMNIRRIAREPHPGEAVLHDVEGFHHHRGKAWAAIAGNDLPLERAFGAEYAAQPRETVAWMVERGDRRRVAGFRAMTGDRGAAAEPVGIHIDGNHDTGAESARGRN